MLVQLNGKTAILTGAASGVGLATAIQFLESGIERLIAVDIAPEPPPTLKACIDKFAERIVYLWKPRWLKSRQSNQETERRS